MRRLWLPPTHAGMQQVGASVGIPLFPLCRAITRPLWECGSLPPLSALSLRILWLGKGGGGRGVRLCDHKGVMGSALGCRPGRPSLAAGISKGACISHRKLSCMSDRSAPTRPQHMLLRAQGYATCTMSPPASTLLCPHWRPLCLHHACPRCDDISCFPLMCSCMCQIDVAMTS